MGIGCGRASVATLASFVAVTIWVRLSCRWPKPCAVVWRRPPDNGLKAPIRLLTHLRYFGYVFNPVSFYYCYRSDGELTCIVAEITNTPWSERHAYVLAVEDARPRGRSLHWSFAKAFHVSPFMADGARLRLAVHATRGRPARPHASSARRCSANSTLTWSCSGGRWTVPR